MIDRYRHAGYVGIGIGIWFMAAGGMTARAGPEWVEAGLLLGLVGWLSLIWGCACYAQAKGFSPWFGVLGVLGLLGPLILYFFPDRQARPSPPLAAQPPSSPFAAPPAQPPSSPYPAPLAPQLLPVGAQRPPSANTGLKVVLWVLMGVLLLGLLSCAGVMVAGYVMFRQQHARARDQVRDRVRDLSNDWDDFPAPGEIKIPQPKQPGEPLADDAPLNPGDRLEAQWDGQWYPVRVVEVLPGNLVKIRWVDWEDWPDEVLPRSRLRTSPGKLK